MKKLSPLPAPAIGRRRLMRRNPQAGAAGNRNSLPIRVVCWQLGSISRGGYGPPTPPPGKANAWKRILLATISWPSGREELSRKPGSFPHR